jgi:hypothetical protein
MDLVLGHPLGRGRRPRLQPPCRPVRTVVPNGLGKVTALQVISTWGKSRPFRSSRPSRPIQASSHEISIEERPAGHLSRSDDSGICQEVGCRAVEYHLWTMLTLSRMTDLDSTRTPEIMLEHTR